MPSVIRALPLFLLATPALADPELVVEQRVFDPAGASSYSGAEMEGGTLVLLKSGRPGSVLVLERDPDSGLWEPVQEVAGVSGGALDLEGGTLVVADMFAQKVEVLRRDAAGQFQVVDTLHDPDPHENGNFGWSVSTDGERIAVGRAPADYLLDCAWVFEPDGNGKWKAAAGLLPPAALAGNHNLAFGRAVAIEGDQVVVGAPYTIEPALQPGEGAAFVFRRQADGSWAPDAQQHHLFDPQGTAPAWFASDLDLDQGTLVVGAPQSDTRGAALVYVQDADGHFVPHPSSYRLLAPPADLAPIDPDTKPRGGFGTSVSVEGDLLLVGSPRSDVIEIGDLEGVAYLFARAAGAWAPSPTMPKVFSGDGDVGDFFGAKVDLDGGFMAVTRTYYFTSSLASAHVFADPFAATDEYVLELDPQALHTGLAVGSVDGLASLVGPGGAVLLDWVIDPHRPGENDLVPAFWLAQGAAPQVVTKPDEALLLLPGTIPQFPLLGFEWLEGGSFRLLPAQGFTGVIELEYAWFVGEVQLTAPARIRVLVVEPGQNQAGEPLPPR